MEDRLGTAYTKRLIQPPLNTLIALCCYLLACKRFFDFFPGVVVDPSLRTKYIVDGAEGAVGSRGLSTRIFEMVF